jgi:hypothetical protein
MSFGASSDPSGATYQAVGWSICICIENVSAAPASRHQRPRDDLAVDRVGHLPHPVDPGDELEPRDVGEVVVEGVAGGARPREHRVEHAADAGLAEPGDEGVDVRAPLEDEGLLRARDVVGGDGDGAVGDVAAGALVGEGVWGGNGGGGRRGLEERTARAQGPQGGGVVR